MFNKGKQIIIINKIGIELINSKVRKEKIYFRLSGSVAVGGGGGPSLCNFST